MAKHTPGPWIPQPDPLGRANDWVISTADGRIGDVATCDKKDARLIACAPELLEELAALVEFFKDTNYYEDHVFTDADQLIAKARGETE